ncbi:MAG: prolyl oligopeptidase family serine peptidase [Thermoplasmata archaeon]
MDDLTIEDLEEYTFLSDLKYSPSGNDICYIVHESDIEENEYDSNLWIYDLENEENYQLTNGNKDKKFIWLNEEEILFISGRDMGVEKEEDEKEEKEKKETKLFLININGGEAKHIDTIRKKVTDMELSGSGVILSVREKIEDEGPEDGSEDEGEDDRYKIEEGEDYHELDEIPYWANGEGFANKKRTHLYNYSLDDNDLDLLIGGPKTVMFFDVKDDKITMNVNEYTDKMGVTQDIYHYNLKKNKMNKLTDGELRIAKTFFLEDKIIFEATDMEAMGINTNTEIYAYDFDEESYEKITDMDKSIGNTVLTDIQYGTGYQGRVENGYYYFIVTEGYDAHLYRFSFDEGVEPVIELGGSIDLFDIHEDEIAYVGLRDLRPQEVYIYEDGKERRITDYNDMEIKLSEPEHFTIESNGKELDVWMMKPVDFEEGKKYPTILEIHGCPKCVYGEVHFNEMQLLVNNGYAVLFSNPLGSSGKGNEFANILDEYGHEDFDDLMNVMDAALERYDFIDEENLGATGGSYGGFMTNWVIGHTDRFNAAVSFRSISNWISKFGITDIGYYFVEDQIQGNPWENFEKLWDRSPMKYSDKVTTPTMFIHSRQDLRCWEAEAFQMFTSLKYHGVDSKLVLFEDNHHGLSREGNPKHRMKRLEKQLEWFDKYLK